MYYTLVSHEFNFKKNNTEEKQECQNGKLLRVLPLINKQVVVFEDNCQFYHLDLNTMKIIYQQKLEGKAFDAIALGKDRIIVMLTQKKNIVEIDLTNKTVSQIYKTTTDSYFNPKKQTPHFFQAKLHCFKESGAFYLQKDLVEDRKVVFIHFSSLGTDKTAKISFQVIQFEAKNNFLYCQLDEISCIARFKQNPEQNGVFSFEQINFKTSEKTEYLVDWSSFVLFSTVVDVRKLNDEKYMICLNGKNSSHEIIVYNKIEKTIQTLITSQKILTRCILLNKTLKLGIFSFIYGEIENSEIIKVLSLENGKIMHQFEAKVDKVAVSNDNSYFIEYGSSMRGNEQRKFNIFSIANKNTNYLKIMENLKIDLKFGQQFMGLIVNMLS